MLKPISIIRGLSSMDFDLNFTLASSLSPGSLSLRFLSNQEGNASILFSLKDFDRESLEK